MKRRCVTYESRLIGIMSVNFKSLISLFYNLLCFSACVPHKDDWTGTVNVASHFILYNIIMKLRREVKWGHLAIWVRGLDSFGTSLFMAVIVRKRNMQFTHGNTDLLPWFSLQDTPLQFRSIFHKHSVCCMLFARICWLHNLKKFVELRRVFSVSKCCMVAVLLFKAEE